MPVSRRNLLKYLGLAPAIPLIGKIPPAEAIPLPEEVSVKNAPVYVSGWCAPVAPLYDLPRTPLEHLFPTKRSR